MADSVVFLRLQGPLQAWGDDSRWRIRSTRREPTKSGIIGLIAGAFGWPLNAESDRRVRELAEEVTVGVRVDQPGTVLRDYHTVLGPLPTAEGKLKKTASTGQWENITSERFYLADACFLAAIQGPRARLEEIGAALLSPHWPPFLGRKSCPPSLPLVPAWPGGDTIREYDDLYQALDSFPRLRDPVGQEPAGEERLRCLIEIRLGTDPARLREKYVLSLRQDQPLAFSSRLFAPRRVYEAFVNPPTGEG